MFRWFQVAMNDSALVGRFQCVRNLGRDRDRFVGRNASGGDAVGERRTFDELHHERADAARFLEAVNVRDVGMVQ
jgi:hypothetical protein